jgi:hypothetical protein
LPETLETLNCSHNNLYTLPVLPYTLKTLVCCYNDITYLPSLPENLQILTCRDNNIYSLSDLPERIQIISCYKNPIYEIIKSNHYDINDVTLLKNNIRIVNHFRHLYYCLKFKNQFRKWLWEKIREQKIIKKYHPTYLIENLYEDSDLDTVLNNW